MSWKPTRRAWVVGVLLAVLLGSVFGLLSVRNQNMQTFEEGR